MIVPIPPDVLRDLVKPAATQLGFGMGEWARLFTEWSRRNVDAILKRMDERRRGKEPLTLEQVELTFPFLRFAAHVSDSELQDKWAVLLESAISEPSSILPSFARTLSELDADEARYIERLLHVVAKAGADLLIGNGSGEVDYGKLLETYDPSLADAEVSSEITSPLVRRAMVVIDDLVRLGILSIRYNALGGGDERDTVTLIWYSFTNYGFQFLDAVCPLPSL